MPAKTQLRFKQFGDMETSLSGGVSKIASASAIKTYVDSKINGLSWKEPAQYVHTGGVEDDGATFGSYTNGDDQLNLAAGSLIVDGNPLEEQDRVLFKSFTGNNRRYNGIYSVHQLPLGVHLALRLEMDAGNSSGKELTDFVGGSITIAYRDNGASATLSEEYKFTTSGNTGDELSGGDAGKINVNINAKSSAEDIVRELQSAVDSKATNHAFKTKKISIVIKTIEPVDGDDSACNFYISARHSDLIVNAASVVTYASIPVFRNHADNGDVASNTAIASAAQAGQFRKPADAATQDDLNQAAIFIQSGITYGDTGWVCSTDGLQGATDPAEDAFNLDFVQFTGAGAIQGKVGISKSATGDLALDMKRDSKEGQTGTTTENSVANPHFRVFNGSEAAVLGSASAANVAKLHNDPATMVFLNGVLIDPISYAAGQEGLAHQNNHEKLWGSGGGADEGGYYMAWGESMIKIILSTDLVSVGSSDDLITIICPSLAD